METPEEIFARRNRDMANQRAQAMAKENALLVVEMKQLIVRAVDRQRTLGYPANSYPRLEEIQWQGKPRVGWKLRNRRGDGDGSGEVFLLASDGLLLGTARSGRYTTLELPHDFTPAEMRFMIQNLERLARIDPPKKGRRRFRF